MKMTKSPSSVIPTARRPTGLPSKVQMLTGLAAHELLPDNAPSIPLLRVEVFLPSLVANVL